MKIIHSWLGWRRYIWSMLVGGMFCLIDVWRAGERMQEKRWSDVSQCYETLLMWVTKAIVCLRFGVTEAIFQKLCNRIQNESKKIFWQVIACGREHKFFWMKCNSSIAFHCSIGTFSRCTRHTHTMQLIICIRLNYFSIFKFNASQSIAINHKQNTHTHTPQSNK